MSAEAIVLEHSVGDGWLEVVIGDRRTILSQATSRLRGDMVAAASSMIPGGHPERMVFLVVDETVNRGAYDRFVRLLQAGQRPGLPDGFCCVCDNRLAEYTGGRS